MAAVTDIGIDLGTSSILVYVKGKGIVLKEPSVVAYDKDADKVKAIGEEARQMIGRTPGNIMAIRPLRQGVISDYMITEKMLHYFIQKAMGRRGFRKPRIVICVPSGVTDVERRAVEDAAPEAGLELNGLVTVADVSKVKMYMRNFGEFYDNQIQHAGTIILSRTQKVSEEKQMKRMSCPAWR